MSCTAIVVINLVAFSTSPPPLAKKKLAPRRLSSKYFRATVREIADLPVPASPLSQKVQHSSFLSAHSYMSCRIPTRVPERQDGSCCFDSELNGASTAVGRRSRISSCAASVLNTLRLISGKMAGTYVNHECHSQPHH